MTQEFDPEELIGRIICFTYCDKYRTFTDVGKIVSVNSQKVFLDDDSVLKRGSLIIKGVICPYPGRKCEYMSKNGE